MKRLSSLLNFKPGGAMEQNGSKKRWITTSVTFDEETLSYIDEVSKREERKRSAMIRSLIREHMRAHTAEPATANS